MALCEGVIECVELLVRASLYGKEDLEMKRCWSQPQIKTVEVATACETRTRTFEVVSKNHSIILSHQKLSPLTLLIKVKVEIDNSFERDINNKDDCC